MSAEVSPNSFAPAKPPSLFDIVERMRAILAAVDDAEGEVSELQEAELDALAGNLDEKAERYAGLVRVLEAEAEASKAVAKRYTDRAQRKAKHVERLKARLLEALKVAGAHSAGGPTGGAFLCASPPTVLITEPDMLIPAPFWRTHAPTVDEAAIKQALLRGEKLDFAQLTRAEHIRWRR